MKTADIKFLELCDEIDYWKERAEMWEQRYKQERDENIAFVNNRLEETKKGVGIALMLALSVRDNEDGSLSIGKEDRLMLAEQLKES